MCGITGYIHLNNEQKAEKEIIRRMTDCISHRGPDNEGYYIEKNIALGHRRLSIIDINTGAQPMLSQDNRVILSFNGEIYNYIELRNELKKLGCIFKTESDTEVIIQAYLKWGIDCQQKFNGMWAFALYDKQSHELFLSRDRIGEKPLHYSIFNNTVIFGSEIKSIIEYGVPAEINTELIELYLFLTYIPTPFTFFKNILKLKPGHYIRIKNNFVQELKYWDLPEIDEGNMLTDKRQIYETFSELFTDSVKLRMRSDVPFGAFLSGGLDSASVVATMSKHSKFPIETFTIGFKEKAFDESFLADAVAQKFKTNHHLNIVNQDSFEDSLHRVIHHFDEPFGDSSAIPTGYVSKFASEKVKMVLTGDGGDEILSGYNSYLGLKISEYYNRFPKFIKNTIPAALNKIAPYTSNGIRYKINKLHNISSTAKLNFNDRMIQKMAYTDYINIKNLIGDQKVYQIEDYVSDFYNKLPVKDDFYKLMYSDIKQKLPDDYLVKVDRMSMSHSIETRVPFLDYRLIEYMVQVDKNVKLQGWEKKSILRKTIGKELPQSLLKAPKKGFGVPLREWFKADSFENQLNNLSNIDFLEQSVLRKIIQQNNSGEKDNGNFIWSIFVLQNWLKKEKI
ncbi:MAG: asparagine synthase (glutamine-hydrolyzing) [Flavobacteriia bacterium]|nr:asparagine synthase (glutamine-hydrolyzing) [Flavobacteriia bacterium]